MYKNSCLQFLLNYNINRLRGLRMSFLSLNFVRAARLLSSSARLPGSVGSRFCAHPSVAYRRSAAASSRAAELLFQRAYPPPISTARRPCSSFYIAAMGTSESKQYAPGEGKPSAEKETASVTLGQAEQTVGGKVEEGGQYVEYAVAKASEFGENE